MLLRNNRPKSTLLSGPGVFLIAVTLILSTGCGNNRRNDGAGGRYDSDLTTVGEAGASEQQNLSPQELKQAIREHITEGIEEGHIQAAGVGVVYTGGLEFYEGEGIARTDSFPVYSLTKSFVAVAAMQLVADKQLKLDVSPADYVPIPPDSRLQKATITDLLNHTSGMSYGGALRQVKGAGGKDFYFTEPVYEPDTTFVYYNDNYALVGAILEIVSGRPLAELLRNRILNPLGMENSAMSDYGDGATGLSSTVEDMARFVCALAGQGSCTGARIIHPDDLARMKTVKAHISYDKLIGGLGLFRGEGGSGLFFYNHGLYGDKTSSFRLYNGFGVIQFSRTVYFRDPGYTTWRARALELGAALGHTLGPPS